MVVSDKKRDAPNLTHPFLAAAPLMQHDRLIRQGDIQLQHRTIVGIVEVDRHLIGFDVNIFANHRDNFLLHLRQEIRLAQIAFIALMRNDDLQTLLRD